MKENIATGIAGGLFGLILAAAIASWQTIVVVAIIYAVGLFSNLATGLLHAKQTDSYSEEKANKKLAEQQTQIDELTLQLGDALLGGAML